MNQKHQKNISNILHTINNHLATSGLSLEMLLQELSEKLSGEQKRYFKSAISDAKKIKILIQKITQYLES